MAVTSVDVVVYVGGIVYVGIQTDSMWRSRRRQLGYRRMWRSKQW